jgi:hypothetical protein
MVVIYSSGISPRLTYISKLIFSDILGVDFQITTDKKVFEQTSFPKINYSTQRFNGEPFLKAGDFLFRNEISLPDITPVSFQGHTGFFETSACSILPFDPLASAFLVVSRMEEYLPGPRDTFGRFEGRQSLLYKYGLLEKPVVNQWAQLLASVLKQAYPGFEYQKKPFRYLSTIDIDNAWAYRNKGFFRSLFSLIKKLSAANFAGFRHQVQSLTGQIRDPYDNYSRLFSEFLRNRDHVIFFFLLGDYSKYDKPVSWKNRKFQQLIKDISATYRVGIHPSWKSSITGSSKRLREEKLRLETIIRKKAERSRQHFLLLKFPDTYRTLIEAGITEDYSMGFADLAGFRAGICTPFRFYDLQTEEETSLTVFPFEVMDVTLRNYMQLPADQAMQKIETLMQEVRKAGGIFAGIWHNESVTSHGQWKTYLPVFEYMNRKGFEYAAE